MVFGTHEIYQGAICIKGEVVFFDSWELWIFIHCSLTKECRCMLIQEYNESWKISFNAISKVLQHTVQLPNLIIEHIGSTAVPGLAAKPIIDIDLVYHLPDHFDMIKNRLGKIGYYHNGDQGIPDREVFKRQSNDTLHPILDQISHHLYVCAVDSKELRNHIAFRDFLMENSTARQQYQELKYQIAAAAKQDRKQYAALKETVAKPFIKAILEKAGEV